MPSTCPTGRPPRSSGSRRPIAVAPGDRLVLRRASGADRIVGAVVLDVAPAARDLAAPADRRAGRPPGRGGRSRRRRRRSRPRGSTSMGSSDLRESDRPGTSRRRTSSPPSTAVDPRRGRSRTASLTDVAARRRTDLRRRVDARPRTAALAGRRGLIDRARPRRPPGPRRRPRSAARDARRPVGGAGPARWPPRWIASNGARRRRPRRRSPRPRAPPAARPMASARSSAAAGSSSSSRTSPTRRPTYGEIAATALALAATRAAHPGRLPRRDRARAASTSWRSSPTSTGAAILRRTPDGSRPRPAGAPRHRRAMSAR